MDWHLVRFGYTGNEAIQPFTPWSVTALSVRSLAIAAALCLSQGCEAPKDNEIRTEVLTAKMIAASLHHTCAIDPDGGVWCWGNNEHGELAASLESHPSSSLALRVPMIDGASAIALGTSHSCALLTGGKVWCWGSNSLGQLGSTDGKQRGPVEIPLPQEATAITSGANHVCAMLKEGVFCWGSNGAAQLGSNNFQGGGSDQIASAWPTPTKTAFSATKIAALSAGDRSTCALVDSDGVHCWGEYLVAVSDESDCPLRPGALVTGCSIAPTRLLPGRWDLISAGSDFACVVRQRDLRCWGNNGYRQLGVAERKVSESDAILLEEDAVQLSARGKHACALLKDGRLFCWGADTFRERSQQEDVLPEEVTGAAGAQHVALGENHVCTLRENGNVECWGSNPHGESGCSSDHCGLGEPVMRKNQ